MKQKRPVNASATRQKLLAAAIDLFGRQGFEGTSIREIARLAKANIAAIAYHFGGKEELYRACLEHIVQSVSQGLREALKPSDDRDLDAEQARTALKETVFAMTAFMLATPEVASFVRLVVREQMDPTPSFDLLYRNFMEPMHRRLCRLWASATGADAESEVTKVAVFSLLGQVLLFRIARAGALRRMGWRDIGERELAILRQRIAINVDLLTRAAEGKIK
jgi:TetR/AcrR family transcriptional regulator, regulator of cefoperazone and chloramphenicol sensitivity